MHWRLRRKLPDGVTSWTAELTPKEYKEAEDCIVRQAQREEFPEEIKLLKQGKQVKASSRLAGLSPFLDEERQLLRIRSRLERVEFLNDDQRYPVILPRKHEATRLVVKRHHEEIGHPVGREATICQIRQKYWILRIRQAVRDWELQCNKCKIRKAKPVVKKMAPIPRFRLNAPLRAFVKCGADFAGPFSIKQGRGKTRVKRYLALYTCLQTRAVHLEPVWSMDTDGFLMSLSRMTSRRSVPEDMLTDNGSNFVAGERELRELVAAIDWTKVQAKTVGYKNTEGIRWHFNPPGGPHFGGIFEIMVKAAKRALNSIVGSADLTDEEFHTFIVEVEGLLNSRPLTPASSDVGDNLPLTPNHFLHGQLGGQLAPPTIDEVRHNPRRRWRHLQMLLRHYWERWQRELLPLLHNRQKWLYENGNLKIDDVVILIDEKTLRGHWRLGRITETRPGEDGVVRVVKVKTPDGVLLRPVHKLCPLEFGNEVEDAKPVAEDAGE